MKKIKTAFKKYIGELSLIIGSFITTYNVFDFNYGCNLRLGGKSHYYRDETRYYITIGVALIVIGILIIRNKGIARI